LRSSTQVFAKSGFPRRQFANVLPPFFLRRHAVGDAAHREIAGRRIRRGEPAAGCSEQRSGVRFGSHLIRQIARVGPRAHHGDDAVIEVPGEVIDQVGARVVLGGERGSLDVADVAVQQDETRNVGLAAQIDAKGATRDGDLTPPGDTRDPAVLDKNRGVFNRRPSGADDEPRAFK